MRKGERAQRFHANRVDGKKSRHRERNSRSSGHNVGDKAGISGRSARFDVYGTSAAGRYYYRYCVYQKRALALLHALACSKVSLRSNSTGLRIGKYSPSVRFSRRHPDALFTERFPSCEANGNAFSAGFTILILRILDTFILFV